MYWGRDPPYPGQAVIKYQSTNTWHACSRRFLDRLSINLHPNARGHILQPKQALCHVELHVPWLSPVCGWLQTLYKATATQKKGKTKRRGVRALPASSVLVSQQQVRMEEMLRLKTCPSRNSHRSAVPCALDFTAATAQRCNLWASHAEPKYMRRFKADSALRRGFP